ncbi:MAG: alpha/beta fold hydrolase [Myxococcaceae bacterium]
MKVSTARSSLVGSAMSVIAEFASGALALPYRPDELYRVPTDDGDTISLGRYNPRDERRFLEPVVLCHGLGANRFDLDFDEKHSLARHLARRGFETWVIELRGRGLAGPARACTFDDQAEHDVGAALRAICSTGAAGVSWVGHSKGGLVMYAHLARHPEAPVRALVTIGSPVSFTVQPGLKRFITTVAPALTLDVIPIAKVGKSLARLGPPPAALSRYLMRAANVDPDTLKRALANLPADIAGGVARQFARWISLGTFDSMDGSIDYREGLRKITAPVLLIAGSRDLLAPPHSVSKAKELLSGSVKMVVAGKRSGFHEDYGHGDLVLGRRAPHEVFPLIEHFLEAQSTRC